MSGPQFMSREREPAFASAPTSTPTSNTRAGYVLGHAATLGDAALGLATARAVEHMAQASSKLLTTQAALFRESVEDPRVDMVPLRPLVPPGRLGYLSALARYEWAPRAWWPSVSPGGAAFVRELEHAAVLAMQGGPYFRRRGLSVGKVLGARTRFRLARRCRVPTVIYGQSFGPYDGVGATLASALRSTLRQVDEVSVRDGFSAEALERIGVDSGRVVQIPDPVWGLYAGTAQQRAEGRCRVALGLRHFQPSYGIPSEVQETLVTEATRWVSRAAGEGVEVTLVSTDHRKAYPDRLSDADVLARIHEGLSAGAPVYYDAETASVEGVMRAFGSQDLVVTGRLHGAILAMCMGVPTVIVAYDAKCYDVARAVGIDDLVIPVEAFSAARLDEAVRSVRDRHAEYAARVARYGSRARAELEAYALEVGTRLGLR